MVLDKLISFFTSLKLTVVCLTLAMVLVFIGTIAQVDLGLYRVQHDYFQSFVVMWGPKHADWRIPVFPGGYLIGGLLLINLVAAHYKRFGFSRKKFGIILTHLGLILLLLGQLGTDKLARESSLHLREGETRNYSESDRRTELAVVETTDADSDKVVAIPDSALAAQSVVRSPALPFTIRVKRFLPNSALSSQAETGYEKSPATQGQGAGIWMREKPRVTKMDERDVPSAVLELDSGGQSLGTWLVSEFLNEPQKVTVGKRTFALSMRLRRYYKPFSLQLVEFRHDVYRGTDIPKNFSSLVRLRNPATGEDREVKIYMNNPLRYAGYTFYQASFDPDNKGSVLQVVHNPGWLTPYLACVLVGLGLTIQFLSHLIPFVKRRLAV